MAKRNKADKLANCVVLLNGTKLQGVTSIEYTQPKSKIKIPKQTNPPV